MASLAIIYRPVRRLKRRWKKVAALSVIDCFMLLLSNCVIKARHGQKVGESLINDVTLYVYHFLYHALQTTALLLPP
jgi:hypothetical protein